METLIVLGIVACYACILVLVCRWVGPRAPRVVVLALLLGAPGVPETGGHRLAVAAALEPQMETGPQ